MTDILFYHLQRQPLEAVLPTLVEKSLARGWRVAIEGPDAGRLTALGDHLGVWRDDSFLPHGPDQAADFAAHALATGESRTAAARHRSVLRRGWMVMTGTIGIHAPDSSTTASRIRVCVASRIFGLSLMPAHGPSLVVRSNCSKFTRGARHTRPSNRVGLDPHRQQAGSMSPVVMSGGNRRASAPVKESSSTTHPRRP